MEIDIRRSGPISKVRFADDAGGTGRINLLRRSGTFQLDLVCRDGSLAGYVKMGDVDALISALKFAKEEWS